jgi:uncharacterized protein
MPAKKEDKLPWYGYAKFCIVPAIVVAWINLYHGNSEKGSTTSKSTKPQAGYEIVEPSLEYLINTASLVEIHDWAKKGSPIANEYLGHLYYTGNRGVQKNIDKAIGFLEIAASKGSGDAAYELAFCYWIPGNPYGKNDATKSDRWLKYAADSEVTPAQTMYGILLLSGVEMPINYNKAFSYLDKASKKDDKDAVYWVGECYANGWGVKSDANMAIVALTSAADATKDFSYKATAQRKLAEAYKYGYGVIKNPKTAFEYFKKSAFLGDAGSQLSLVQAYLGGSGVVPSTAAALVWVYANRATGGTISDQLLSSMEKEFNNADLSEIRAKAREVASIIETNKSGSNRSSEQAPNSRSVKATGTGVIISSAGLIITAAHVVRSSSRVEVCLPSGNQLATTVEVDSRNDLAVLRIGGSGYSAAPIIPSRDVKLGQPVFTIGFPNTEIQGSSPKFTKGEISSLNGMQDEPTQWQISVPVQSGNSGSPLFDEAGNVVGVVVSKLNALETAKTTGDLAQNVNYAVKNAYLIPMLEKFQDKLPAPRKRGMFKSFESVVEDSKKSVVLILAY